jgi:hypothetical protein
VPEMLPDPAVWAKAQVALKARIAMDSKLDEFFFTQKSPLIANAMPAHERGERCVGGFEKAGANANPTTRPTNTT